MRSALIVSLAAVLVAVVVGGYIADYGDAGYGEKTQSYGTDGGYTGSHDDTSGYEDGYGTKTVWRGDAGTKTKDKMRTTAAVPGIAGQIYPRPVRIQ